MLYFTCIIYTYIHFIYNIYILYYRVRGGYSQSSGIRQSVPPLLISFLFSHIVSPTRLALHLFTFFFIIIMYSLILYFIFFRLYISCLQYFIHLFSFYLRFIPLSFSFTFLLCLHYYFYFYLYLSQLMWEKYFFDIRKKLKLCKIH